MSVAALGLPWLVALLTSGCAAVAPRLPVPLPDHGVAVGVLGGGGAGDAGSVSFRLPYQVGFGGASVAWQAMRVSDFALELDGAVGAGAHPVFGVVVPLGGALGGVRVWYLQPAFALGLDANTSAMIGVMQGQASFQGGGPQVVAFLQQELRVLGALRLVDHVWLGVRPGVVLVMSTVGVSGAVDVPLAVAWDVGMLRLGLEAGWVVPFGGRGGVSAAILF